MEDAVKELYESEEIVLPRGIVVLDASLPNEDIQEIRSLLDHDTEEVFLLEE